MSLFLADENVDFPIITRLRGLDTGFSRLPKIVQAFATHSGLFPGRFTVISLDQIRVRPHVLPVEKS